MTFDEWNTACTREALAAPGSKARLDEGVVTLAVHVRGLLGVITIYRERPIFQATICKESPNLYRLPHHDKVETDTASAALQIGAL